MCPIDNVPELVLDNGLAPNGDKPLWSNADPIHWRLYAALGGNELIIYDS